MAGASGIINAKVQVDPKELERLYSHTPELESEFNKIGFTAMTIDPDGYRAPARNNSLRKASARPGDR
jgi:PP-loop superfamily ATP-utilizing enzyme